MRKFIAIFLLLFLGKSISATPFKFEVDSIKEISTENQIIKYENKVLGKYITETKKSVDNKFTRFFVKVFENGGVEVAEFEIEILNKVKKNEDAVKDAILRTAKDNVSHNGNNFIDFHAKHTPSDNKDEAPQLKKAIEYLIENNYLETNI